MAHDWLVRAASTYNMHSLEAKDDYAAILLMPVETLSEIIGWTFTSLPDEILVGIDPDVSLPHPDGVDMRFTCLLYTSPSPRDATLSRMPSSA